MPARVSRTLVTGVDMRDVRWFRLGLVLSVLWLGCTDNEWNDDDTATTDDDVADDDAADDDTVAGESAYPKINYVTWGGASPTWYAEFDWLVSTTYTIDDEGVLAKQINPDLVLSSTRDTNMCPDGWDCPSPWRVKDSAGADVTCYGTGYLGDTSGHCDDHEGQTYRDYVVQWAADLDWGHTDGWNTDCMYETIGWLAAVDIDGDGDSDTTDESLWLDGQIATLAEIRAAIGDDKLMTVNAGMLRTFGDQAHLYVNGGMSEKFMMWEEWSTFLERYEYYAKNAREPHMTYINNHADADPDEGADSKDNFQYMRFGLAATLLWDGYYSYEDNDSPKHNEHWWARYYDEYDVPLGEPLADPVEIRQDVFCRIFEHGAMVLNGAVQDETITEVDLQGAVDSAGLLWQDVAGDGGHFYRFSGQQAPDFNDGSQFDSITLPGKLVWNDIGREARKGDGILLVHHPAQPVVAAVIVDTDSYVTSPGAVDAQLQGFSASCDDSGGFRTGFTYCSDTYPLYRHYRASVGSGATATFEVALANGGWYRVLEFHPEIDGRDVPHVVTHDGGETTYLVDQSVNAEQWNLLDTVYFTPDQPARVVVSADASGTQVAADAIRFEWVSAE